MSSPNPPAAAGNGRRFAFTAPAPAAQVLGSNLRFGLRALRLASHLGLALLLCAIINLDFTGRVDADDWARRWLRRLMRIMGIHFRVHGTPAAGGQMIVCNHVSWVDIPLVGAALSSRFVAKSEIRQWPLIGFIARAIGTFFIRRGPGGSRPLLEKLKPHLDAGGSVVIFPEGTTTDGKSVLPFHPRLFQAALDCHMPVQPVALRYGLTADGEDIAPFIGEDDLLSHIVRMLKSPGLRCELHYGTPLLPDRYADRGVLAADAEACIRRLLGAGA